MTTYSLTCINKTQQMHGSFAVFQKAPPITVPANVFSLAWLARPTAPGTEVTFEWSLDYCFVWSESGILKPGVNFKASQTLAADPYGKNNVQLTVDDYGASMFDGQDGSGADGSLTIKQLSGVVPGRTSVGIGMSGSGTYVIQAAPNMTAVFTPHPNYWVAFGNFRQGDVVDIEDVSGVAEITYGGSLTSRKAVFGLDNIITVS